ncbi:hypothetical protein BH20ACT4_BH20ACT4_04370 [soil metagenome]
MSDLPAPFDLAETPVHIGGGSTIVPLTGFSWSPEYLEAYEHRFRSDGGDGRLVTFGTMEASIDVWERHPAGDELVLVVNGRVTMIQEIDGKHHRIALGPHQAAINPPGTWHTFDVDPSDGPATFMTITAGVGTEHRSR